MTYALSSWNNHMPKLYETTEMVLRPEDILPTDSLRFEIILLNKK
jgi:hypothetical protein